uniref:Uncharacterized protein n=1 Tax=Arundo donax TaxID=35708 RepID=A0A0A8Y4B6_ARUDO
MRSGGNLYL